MIAGEPDRCGQIRNRWLQTILVTAFVLRASAGIGLQYHLDSLPNRQFLIEGDANGYWELSRTLATKNEFVIHDPPRYIMRMPGFPALLVFSGGSFLVARLLLAGIGTLACWLVFLLGRELVDQRTGVIAAGLASISPFLIGFSILILSETAFAVFMLLSLLSAHRMLKLGLTKDTPSTTTCRWAFLTGLLIALASYMRPSWLLAAPILAIVTFLFTANRKRAIIHGTLIIAGTFFALLPWAIRNQRVTGHFVVTTLWAGPSLYDGLNPSATGESDMTFFDQDNFLDQMSEFEMNRHYNNLAWNFVRTHPGQTAQLALTKLVRYWKPWPNAEEFRRPWLIAGSALWFLLFYSLATIGLFQNRNTVLFLLVTLGPIIYFSAIHSVFIGSIRYRVPTEYPLCILSAVGLSVVWKWRCSRTFSK
jgi:4-amino-4-deoxy-L-arabinose transferase-like glycosyltransferase